MKYFILLALRIFVICITIGVVLCVTYDLTTPHFTLTPLHFKDTVLSSFGIAVISSTFYSLIRTNK